MSMGVDAEARLSAHLRAFVFGEGSEWGVVKAQGCWSATLPEHVEKVCLMEGRPPRSNAMALPCMRRGGA